MYKCPVCNNYLIYLQSEDYGEEGIIEFYECIHCHKLITVSDNVEEEEEF